MNMKSCIYIIISVIVDHSKCFCASFTHSDTDGAASGTIRGSVFCSKALQQVNCRFPGSNQEPSDNWMTNLQNIQKCWDKVWIQKSWVKIFFHQMQKHLTFKLIHLHHYRFKQILKLMQKHPKGWNGSKKRLRKWWNAEETAATVHR